MSYSRFYIVLQINYIEMDITNLEVISWGRSLDKFESTAVFDMAKDKTEQDKLTNVWKYRKALAEAGIRRIENTMIKKTERQKITHKSRQKTNDWATRAHF